MQPDIYAGECALIAYDDLLPCQPFAAVPMR